MIGNRLFDLPFVGIDDEKAMYDLSVAIADRVPSGRILYLAPALKKPLHSINAQRMRLRGFVRAMELSDFGGIVCATDHYALGALKHLGYPKNIPIAGFDNISMLKNINVRVLSVEYSTDKIAEEAVNYILGRRYSLRVAHSLVYNTDEISVL